MLGLLTGEGIKANGMPREQSNALQEKQAALPPISSALPEVDTQAYASLPPLNSAVATDRSQETSGTSSGELCTALEFHTSLRAASR